MNLEQTDIVPEFLKSDFVKTVGSFSWELHRKNIIEFSEDFLMGDNRTLSFSRNQLGKTVIYVCEFNQPPYEPVYTRFIERNNGTSLDMVDEDYEYVCPHKIGKSSLEDHIRLARIATDFLRSI